jgi:cyclic-di-GMP phosphodiesterase TipF (flagellum assembly factor)
MPQTQSVTAKLGRVAVASHVMVLAAIAVVTLGLGLALRVQLGLPTAAAGGTAAVAGCLMFLLHLALMRGQRIAELEQEVTELWSVIGAKPSSAGRGAAPVADALPSGIRPRERTRPVPEAATPVVIAPPPPPAARESLARSRSGRTLEEETEIARSMAEPAPPPAGPPPAALHGRPNLIAPAAPLIPDAAIAESVRSLKATAQAMRAPHSAAPQWDDHHVAEPAAASLADDPLAGRMANRQSAPHPAPAEPAAPLDESRLGDLADALAADRIDVLLQPILGLKDQATRHFEVSVALRGEDGAVLETADDRPSLVGSGILPLIDLAKITRVAEVARRLAERGRSGAVFTALAGESLADDDVMGRVSEIYTQRVAITEQLVIALAQHDVRAFAPAHWKVVQDLCRAGFRFALAGVTDLDMDFDMMRAAGIQYVKLDAEVFLQGLPTAQDGAIPAHDVYAFLAEKGLSLIVEHIDSEAQLMRVVECGALYGQGRLFGEPRPVKAEIFAGRSAA